jgi:single-stranded-DNA-specific exonuclease
MPLLGPNRSIVKYGLESLHETKIPGLVALFQAAGIAREKIGTYEIGFIIGPRLNAAGRMEDPMEALRLICTKDKERAVSLATKIDEQNRQRQLLTEQATLHARSLWLTDDGKRKMIFVSHESYEEGIVGLVAGKLMEEFYRPAIVVSKGEKYSRASARSTPGFNIIEAIRACADILGPHGGHPMAAGFTVETVKLEELKMRLVKIAEREINKEKLTPVLKIDMRLDCRQLTLELCEKLTELAPFGVGNPEPVFLTRGFLVADAQLVGANSSHLKLHLTCPSLGIIFEAIGFGKGNLFSSLSPEVKIDLVYNLSLDTWNGNRRIQLKIKDLKVSDGKRA